MDLQNLIDGQVETMMDSLQKAKVYEVSVHIGKSDIRFPVGKELLETLNARATTDEAKESVRRMTQIIKDSPVAMNIAQECHSIDVNMRHILNKMSIGRTHLVPESRLEELMSQFEEKKSSWDKAVEKIGETYEEKCAEFEEILRDFFDTYAPDQTDVVIRKFHRNVEPLEVFKRRFHMTLEMSDIPDDLHIFSDACQQTLREVKENSLRNQCFNILKGIVQTQIDAVNEYYTQYSERVIDRGLEMTKASYDKMQTAITKTITDNVIADQRLLQISNKMKGIPTAKKAGDVFQLTEDVLIDIYCYTKEMSIQANWKNSVVPEEDLQSIWEDM